MIRRSLARFMTGRYGGDQLNLFLILLYCLFYIVFLFTRLLALQVLGTVVLAVSLFRSLSRNLERRRAENSRFLQTVRPLWRKWAAFRARAHDRSEERRVGKECGS